MVWENYRLDPLNRLVIPEEAMQEMGWAQGELLELERSCEENALILRAQGSVHLCCCACRSSRALLPVGGGRWLCKSCFDKAAVAASRVR